MDLLDAKFALLTSRGKSTQSQGTGGDSPSFSSPYQSSRSAVKPVCWTEDHCGGFVGSTKNIVCSRIDCTVKEHRRLGNQLTDIDKDTLFVPAPRTGCCYKTPSLSLSDYQVSSSLQEFLLQHRDPDEMSRVFGMIKKGVHEDLVELSLIELEDFVGGAKTKWIPSTPSAMKAELTKPLKLGDRLEMVEESEPVDSLLSVLEAVVGKLAAPTSPAEDDELVIISEFPKLRDAFIVVVDVLRSFQLSIGEDSNQTEYMLVETMKRLQHCLSGVYAVIGEFSKEEETFQDFGNDVSSVLAAVVKSVAEVQKTLGLTSGDDLPAKKASLVDRLEDVETTLREKLMHKMSFLISEVLALKEFQETAEEKMDKGDGQEGKMKDGKVLQGTDMSFLTGCVDDALTRVEVLEGKVSAIGANSPASGDRVKGSFKIRGQDLSDPDSSRRFLVAAGAYGDKPGYFYDLFSLGNYCDRSERGTELEDKAAASRAQVVTGIHDLSVVMSFRMDRPPQFGFEREIVRSANPKTPTFVLPHVKTIEDLYSPDPYRKKSIVLTYDAGSKLVASSLNGLRSSALIERRAVPVYEVATEMNVLTLQFIRDLHQEYEFFYRRITSESYGTTEVEAWALISEMIAAILKEIFSARTSVFGTDLLDEKDLVELTAKTLTSTFRAHAKMSEITMAGFTKHSCVVPALSLHLFSRKASIHTIIELQEKIVELEKRLKLLEAVQPISRSEMDKKIAEMKAYCDAKVKAAGGAKKNPAESNYVLVLASEFPWSPSVLTARFKIKIFIYQDCRLLKLAQEYYHRFGLEVLPLKTLDSIGGELEEASVILDEGWRYTPPEVRKVANLARTKAVLRVGSGFKVANRDPCGGLQRWMVKHADVGGVTDAESNLYLWYSRTPGNTALPLNGVSVARDLRSILKSGLDGERRLKPRSFPVEIVDRVVMLSPGEVSAAGLFPLKGMSNLPKVRTRFGSKAWVVRELHNSELFAMKDMPEPLLLMIKNSKNETEIATALFRSCRTPLKSLGSLVVPVLLRLMQNELDNASTANAVAIVERQPTKSHEKAPVLRASELECRTSGELVLFLTRLLVESQDELRSKKSDYELPTTTMWDVRVLPFCRIIGLEGERLNWRRAFDTSRRVITRRWKRSLIRSIQRFREGLDTFQFSMLEAEAMRDCVERIGSSSLWGWEGGSRPFFWRWSVEWQSQIRNGFDMWLRSEKVSWNKPQPAPNQKDRPLMMRKLQEVRLKGYLQKGKAKALIRFFGVPKGDTDIRMVYDGTRSGLNSSLWAPGFPLPTVSSHLRIVDKGSWMADNDAGEFFLNWMMDSRIQELCGVDITHFLLPEEQSQLKGKSTRWVEIWKRCAMGLRPSPYICVKGMMLATEEILGNREDQANVFRWDYVLLNLPGMETFNSSKPWVSKRRRDGTLAADLICFVDDLRPVAPTEGECWEASQVVSKKLAYLGLQDASRKRNPPSQSPGPWAGIVVTTDDDKVFVSVSKKKWDRARNIIGEISDDFRTGITSYKSLESKTGYLVYVAQAYPSLKPYLTGLYATLNGWRSDRDSKGWKKPAEGKRRKMNPAIAQEFELDEDWQMNRWELDGDEEEMPSSRDHSEMLETHPATVQFVERAGKDLEVLRELVAGEMPPLRTVRGNETVSLLYGFGDASGYGFGAAMQLGNGDIYYQAGLWGNTFSTKVSSNYRELRNLVDFVHNAADAGLLANSQLMLFTDNLVADYAFHKGSSTSEELHKLVVRLRKLEMSLAAELMVVHVSGLRMIESGVDGISRGDMSAGVMAGQAIHSFIPLHQSAVERCVELKDWIVGWAGTETEFLSPDRWPDKHASGGTYVWFPPPAAADAVVDWLGGSTHKRSTSVHVVIVPRLFTARWKKNLGKLSDLQFEIPCGVPVWPAGMFENLDVFISLPLRRSCNEEGSWRFKGSKHIGDIGIAVSGMWEGHFIDVRDTLRKLLVHAREVRAM